MNYQQTIDFLYARLPVFHRIGAAALKPSLNNIIALCDALGNPHQKFKSIHIGGTNGKGSTSHLLAAVLQSAGYKVGLHTSPHLKSFNERFKINGKPIEEQFVVEFVADNLKLIEQIQPSFFEISVALAFDCFAKQAVDIAVIEVGLGGRLDSTNIIEPLLSIITNISFDHTDLLGDTLEKIATEKAGIIKYHTPVVVSETHFETENVFRKKAAEQHAPIVFADQHYKIVYTEMVSQGQQVSIMSKGNSSQISTYTLDLIGAYQLKNLLGVLCAITELRKLGYAIDEAAIKEGFKHCTMLTTFKGRWQILQKSPLVIADVAHNKAGLELNIKQLQQFSYNRLHFVLGFVKDKDISGILALFPQDAHYYFCSFDLPRALPAEELLQQAAKARLEGSIYKNPSDALHAAGQQAEPNDIIYIGGSTFVLSELSEI